MWREPKRYLIASPRLADGTRIDILHPGDFNDHRGGPDFLGARISIDGIVISGDIELHRNTSDWDKHGHTSDPNYASVILHVVLDADEEIHPHLPTLLLRENLRFDERSFWQRLFEARYARAPELPCYPHNLAVPMKRKRALIAQMATLRLDELVSRYECGSHEALLDAVYAHVMDALGYSENRAPMKELARLLPRAFLQTVRERENAASLRSIFEALYFGVAGLLDAPSAEYSSETNEYLLDLGAKWQSLQVDYDIPATLARNDWAFFRIRPTNTPYRRVALAASLAARYFSRSDFSLAEEFRFDDETNWWLTHTSYTSVLDEAQSLLGDERLRAIEINVLLPARIAALRLRGTDAASVTSEKMLRREWEEAPSRSSATYMQTIEQELLEGERLRTTAGEQGALHLYRTYCSCGRCAECPVGKQLIETGWQAPLA